MLLNTPYSNGKLVKSGLVVQGLEVEHVIRSVMRKQAMAAQQAALDLASQQLSRVAAS